MKKYISILFVLLFAVTVYGQGSAPPSPHKWSTDTDTTITKTTNTRVGQLHGTHGFFSQFGVATNSWRIGDATGPVNPLLGFYNDGSTMGAWLRFDTLTNTFSFNKPFGTVNWTAELADGTNGYQLTTDGAGTATWQPAGGVAAGTVDTFFVKDSIAGSTEGWKVSGDTLFVDTTSHVNIDTLMRNDGDTTTGGTYDFSDGILTDINVINNLNTLTARTLDAGLGLNEVNLTVSGWVDFQDSLFMTMGAPIDMKNGDIISIDSLYADAVYTDTVGISGDKITDFAGTNLSVDGSGVLNASGLGGVWDTTANKDTVSYSGVSDTAIKITRDGVNDTTKMSVPSGVFQITGGDGTPIIVFGLPTDLDSTRWDSILTDIREKDLLADGSIEVESYLDFNPDTLEPAHQEGRIWWDSLNDAPTYFNSIPAVSHQIGQEMWVRVKNTSGSTINDGKVVYIDGASGDLPTIQLADADLEATCFIIGVATHDIPTTEIGYVTIHGAVRGIDLQAFSSGDILYLSQTAGEITATPPTSPACLVQVGIVTNNTPNGSMQVTVDLNKKLTELSDVLITGISSGDFLRYNGTVWVNVTSITSGDIEDQTIIKDDMDTTGSNVPFDGAYHITTAAADSAYVTANTINDTADVLRAEMGDSAASASVTTVVDNVWNNTAETLPKGTPVYVESWNIGQGLENVDSAKASSLTTMPALGLVVSDILSGTSGEVMISGNLGGLNTSDFAVGDAIYVGEEGGDSARPTNGNFVQAIGVCVRSHASSGVIRVLNSGRVNDLPNLIDGSVWVGGADSVAILANLDSAIAAEVSFDNSTIDTNASGQLRVASQGVTNSQIDNQTILPANVDSSQTFVFTAARRGTDAGAGDEADSTYMTANHVVDTIGDLTLLLADTGAYTTTILGAVDLVIEDSLDNYMDSTRVESKISDSLALALLKSGGAATGDIVGKVFDGDSTIADSQYATRHFADSVAAASSVDVTNLDVLGDVGIRGGHLKIDGWRHLLDTSNSNTTNADTFLFLPEVYASADSHAVTHPSVIYRPDGLFGFRYWMAFTPLIDTGGIGVEPDDVENPCIAVSNDGDNWFPVDTITGSGLTNPAIIREDVGTGADTADFLSDPDLLMAADGHLWMIFRAKFEGDTEPDTVRVYAMRLDPSDTLWDEEVLILDDTTKTFHSPSIILGANKTYTIFAVDVRPIGDSSVVFKYTTANRPDSGWVLADSVDWPATQDTTMVWHIEVIPNGADELIGLTTERGGATAPYRLHITKSIDGGDTWGVDTVDADPLLSPSGLTNAFDETSIYRASGIWVEDGRGQYLDMFYSAIGPTGPDMWSTARTSVFFNDTTTFVQPRLDTVSYLLTALGDMIGSAGAGGGRLKLKGADYSSLLGATDETDAPIPYTRDSIESGTNVQDFMMAGFMLEQGTFIIDSIWYTFRFNDATSGSLFDSSWVYGSRLFTTGDTASHVPDSSWKRIDQNSFTQTAFTTFKTQVSGIDIPSGYDNDFSNLPVNVIMLFEGDAGDYMDVQRVSISCRKTVVIQ